MIIDNQMCQLKIARHFFVVAQTNLNGIKLVFDSIFLRVFCSAQYSHIAFTTKARVIVSEKKITIINELWLNKKKHTKKTVLK